MFAEDHKMASDYELWRARYGDGMTEEQFYSLALDHRIRLLREIESFNQ